MPPVEIVRHLDAWTVGGKTTHVMEEGGEQVVYTEGRARQPTILDLFGGPEPVEQGPEPGGDDGHGPEHDHELRRILRHRAGQGGGWIVVDDPSMLPRSWTTTRGTLHVLTRIGREHFARVADEVAHLRSWSAFLVRSWISRWREREDFMDLCEEFPGHVPGLFSGGAQWPWERHDKPPVRDGDDLAAQLLHEHGLDHVAARAAWEPCKVEFDRCVCGQCWRVDMNLRLAPLRPGEALACWPR